MIETILCLLLMVVVVVVAVHGTDKLGVGLVVVAVAGTILRIVWRRR